VYPLGGRRSVPLNTRFIAATNRPRTPGGATERTSLSTQRCPHQSPAITGPQGGYRASRGSLLRTV
jgi:hypothetical protein